jgi:hypothetical protein
MIKLCLSAHSHPINNHSFFFSFIIYMCIQGLWVISPPATTPSLTTHSTPSLSSPHPQYPAETILPLSLILLKREYKQ